VSWPIRDAGAPPEGKAVTPFVREARRRKESGPKMEMLFGPTTMARRAKVVVQGSMP
jgi:hypothetical protein